MSNRFWIITVLFFPALVFGQNTLPDTIADRNTYLKSKGEYILETTQEIAYTIVINEFLARNSELNFDNYGDDDDWFEIYNYGEDSVNIADLWFTDNPTAPFKWRINTAENIYLLPNDHLIFWADEETEEGYNHASFKLSGDGEYLGIYANDSILIDGRFYISQTPNISYGRAPDGGMAWNYFSVPTPGSENNGDGGQNVLTRPAANHEGGFYDSPLLLSLVRSTDGSEIRYTLDCTEPNQNSLLYTESILLDATTIVRAKEIKEGFLDSPILTLSFFLEQNNYDNPVLSIVSEPENLFGENGVISSGTSNIEIPANFEYIIGDYAAYSTGTGIQLHANGSGNPNSLRFYARSRYGNSWFIHPFFSEDGPEVHKRLILRNSGNDNVNISSQKTHLRDPLAHKIAQASNTNALISASRLVNVYMNGQYYGLYNLRERIDEYYIETHASETENFDLIERAFGFVGNTHVICGNIDDWNDLLIFADSTGDLSKDADFRIIEDEVDLLNFTDYWITEVFLGNYDWLSNNVKFWKAENGKWQWIYWDLDHGLGLPFSNYGNISWNTLKWSLSLGDRAWPSGYNNLLIRNLLNNETYKKYFIERSNYLLNTALAYHGTKPLFDEMKSTYQNDMVFHALRWNNNISDWNNACITIDNYLKYRPEILLDHIQEFFELGDPVPVSINIQPPGAGTFNFGSSEIRGSSYVGKHFPGTYEINTKSIPGYTLYHVYANNESILNQTFELSDSTEITAIFKPEDDLIPLEFTEIFFNNREKFDCGDWIELYYYGNSALDLSGYSIIGSNNESLYTFETGTIIDSRTYFVVTEDSLLFKNIFTGNIHRFGNTTSGFSNQLNFKLLSKEGELLTEIDLGETFNIPSLPDEGYSYALYNSVSGQNWELSPDKFGSPGINNSNSYNFHPPLGKDSIINNWNPVAIRFESTRDFYSDEDNHEPEKIFVNSISGPGFSSDIGPLVSNTLYDLADFFFDPTLNQSEETEFSYKFIDRSGEMSQGNTILFKKLTDLDLNTINSIKQYPSPAQDVCYFEINEEPTENIHLTLFDVSGKIIIEIDSEYSERISIDLSGVQTGIYFYLIHSNNKVFNGKIEVIK